MQVLFILSCWMLLGATGSQPNYVLSANPPEPEEAEDHKSLPPEFSQFIKGMILLTLPQPFEDDDDWGASVRVQSGLDVEFRDGKLRTQRRWKQVPHGSWVRFSGTLIAPEDTLQVQIARLSPPESDQASASSAAKAPTRYQVRILTRVRFEVRQQQWNYGVRLWSVSSDIEADVGATAVLSAMPKPALSEDGLKLRLNPAMESCRLELLSMSLRRVSHAKGAAVRELGRSWEPLVAAFVARQGNRVVRSTNRKFQKDPDRFAIPLSFLSHFSGSSATTSQPVQP